MRISCLLLCALLCAAAFAGGWTLWESPSNNAEVVDQQQTVDDGMFSMQGAGFTGQTFTPKATPLVRLDFKLKNRADMRPGLFRLWKWVGNLAATRKEPPLFEDVVDLTGRDNFQQRSFFPNIAVEVGAVYYFEFTRPCGNGYYVLGDKGDREQYPSGDLYLPDGPRPGKDVWFKTYTSPRGAPPKPELIPSDPAPWTAPGNPGPAVTRADYLNLFKQAADDQRRFTTTSDNKYSYAASVYDAVLYRETKDEQYAKNVALIFRNAAKWRAANPTEEVGFGWMEYPGIAYLCVRESPSLTADDHAVIRKLLLDSARLHWPLHEFGSMNRSLGSAVTYLLVTRLYPDIPEAKEWAAYADGVWNEFWKVRDTDEDSGHYNYLGWRYILEYAMLSGQDDKVWADPQFKTLVDRFFNHFSPLGVDAGYGDALGWAVEWPTAIWLFEKASAKWHDGKYAWLAHRIFAYHRDHLRDAKLWIAIYQDTICLALAYFDADEKIAETQPESPHETLAAHQDKEDANWTATKNAPLGFTFTPTASPLVKLEVKARNSGDAKPITVKLWKWQKDYATTTAESPLYQDTLTCGATYEVKALCPFLSLERGASYYLEFARGDTAFELAGTKTTMKGATLRYQDDAKAGALWFRSYTLSAGGSTVTARREAIIRPTEQRHVGWYDFGPNTVPEKLVLRSGYGTDDFYAMFDLLAGYGHGHTELGALCALTDHGAVLLHANDYRDDAQDQDESIFLVKRYAGGQAGEGGTHVAITHFTDYRRATVAWADWTDSHGWGAQMQRRFYFVKNRFLLVRDHVAFPAPMLVAAGPVWHAYDVARSTGENWFDVYWREPRGLAWKYKNPERYLFLWLAPRAGYAIDAWKEQSYTGQYTTAPFILAQRWSGDAKAGDARWFDSLLLPHGTELTPEAAAASVKTLYDDGTAIALQITCGEESWLVVDNPNSMHINAKGLDTDAQYLLARAQLGKPDYLLARNATLVKWGTLSKMWATPATVEIGGE